MLAIRTGIPNNMDESQENTLNLKNQFYKVTYNMMTFIQHSRNDESVTMEMSGSPRGVRWGEKE